MKLRSDLPKNGKKEDTVKKGLKVQQTQIPERSRDSISECAEDAIIHRIHNATYRLFDLTDASKGGSCVAVAFEDRILLATAAHVLCERHRFGVPGKDGLSKCIEDFARIEKDDDTDVGLLELDSGVVSRLSTCYVDGFKSIGRIATNKPEFVWVTGYPGEFILRIAPNTYGCGAFTPTGVTVPLGELPDKLRHGIKRNEDIVIEFDQDDRLKCILPQNAANAKPVINRPPPDLHGVSGAGIWANTHKLGKRIWKPHPKLVGIQTGQKQEGKYICGCTIKCWLNLVAEVYPELRSRFESIKKRRPVKTKFISHF